MREIKFRGKEIESGKWVYGGLFKEPAPPQCFEKTLKDKYWIVYPDPRYMPDWNLPYKMVRTDVEKDTIGQYTGLKDKNGKEIYDGDIIHINNNLLDEFNYLIVWNEEYLRYYLFSIDKKSINRLGGILEAHLGSMKDKIEIIGNKWDNPELLKEGE